MKVLFQSRTTLFSVPGGDTVQVLKTKEYLENLGVSVDISTELEPDLSLYDMVHLFNLIRPQEVLTQARNAKRQGKKTALSTIYALYTEYDRRARQGIGKLVSRVLSVSHIEYCKTIARGVKNGEIHRGIINYLVCGHRRAQEEIVSLVDLFLPNSESEMKRVIADFPSAKQKLHVVVPNGVDAKLFAPAGTTLPPGLEKYRDCVLCVARIEGIKNQLNLVRAMAGLQWPLVLVGKPAPNHYAYFEQVRRELGASGHILGHIEHEFLPQLYAAAKVHVLASWMETTGLSSLEAATMGCNLVITGMGDTRDYFGEYGFYCEPDSVESIRSAIIQAYEAPVKDCLRNHVLKNYTWEKAAQRTLEGYERVCKN